jgi:hypothetical protein
MRFLPLVAFALLKTGVVPADFTVQDHSGKTAKFSTLRSGHPTIVFYEDKDGGEQNDHFKQRLGKLQGKSPAAKKVVVVAIADVSSWNFWPAKGFVKNALESAGKKAGVTVWADWSGAGRASLSASSDASNIVMLDASGRVVWASSGKLTVPQEDDLLNRVEKLGT